MNIESSVTSMLEEFYTDVAVKPEDAAVIERV